jgi:uncharacterized membrane protein
MDLDARMFAKKKLEGNKWNINKTLLIIAGIEILVTLILNLFGFKAQTDFSRAANTNEAVYSIVTSVLTVALLPTAVGLIVYVVNLINDKKFEIKQLFCKYTDFVRIFLSDLVMGLFIFLWSLLLIVPGIIKAIEYSLVNYMLADKKYDDLGTMDLLKKSKTLMYGHRKEWFMMNLYYFGLLLLGVLTLGIYWIWVIPEATMANAKFARTILDKDKA